MELIITHAPAKADKELVLRGIQEFNQSRFEKAGFEELGIFFDDEAGERAAGLTGVLRGRWLFIHLLWVREDMRGKGLGSRLLAAAEEEGRAFGCGDAFVDTFEFQAPGFYEKYGYQEVFSMQVHAETGRHIYYTKPL